MDPHPCLDTAIITIAGDAGGGKSTVAKLVARELGYAFRSTGDLRGEIAMRHGITIDELNSIGRTHAWPHRECDDLTAAVGRTEKPIVFDSWLAWHFLPESLKVYIRVDPRVGAARIFANQRPDERRASSREEMERILADRFANWHYGVQQHYGVNVLDMANYNLVLDSTDRTPADVAQAILSVVRAA